MRKKMWHCKSCGRVCDSSNTVCPDCGLDLGFYGEIQFVETGEPEPSSPSGFRTQEQAAPTAEEQSRPERKEENKNKRNKPKPQKEHMVIESKPKKEGKGSIVLISTGMALMLLWMFPISIILGKVRWTTRLFYHPIISVLELAACVCLAAALFIMMVRKTKRSSKKEGKCGIVLVLTGGVSLVLLILFMWWLRIQWPILMSPDYINFSYTSYYKNYGILRFCRSNAAGICLAVDLLLVMVQAARGASLKKEGKGGKALIWTGVALLVLLTVIMLFRLVSSFMRSF